LGGREIRMGQDIAVTLRRQRRNTSKKPRCHHGFLPHNKNQSVFAYYVLGIFFFSLFIIQ
jgi:hypothetical protein